MSFLNINKCNFVKYREIFFNIIVAAYYMFFLYNHGIYFLQTYAVPTLLFIIFEATIIFLALSRRVPKDVSFKAFDWIVASIGTYTPLLMISNVTPFKGDLVLSGIYLIAVCFSIFAMFSLGRSYGTVAANRGIQTTGLYRFVRHPIYAGYFISLLCFVLLNQSVWNFSILIIVYIAKIARIHCEEKLLSKDIEYKNFMAIRRWRLFPKIW